MECRANPHVPARKSVVQSGVWPAVVFSGYQFSGKSTPGHSVSMF
jgi:hypothetical protein